LSSAWFASSIKLRRRASSSNGTAILDETTSDDEELFAIGSGEAIITSGDVG
jgi:hypothetical protein